MLGGSLRGMWFGLREHIKNTIWEMFLHKCMTTAYHLCEHFSFFFLALRKLMQTYHVLHLLSDTEKSPDWEAAGAINWFILPQRETALHHKSSSEEEQCLEHHSLSHLWWYFIYFYQELPMCSLDMIFVGLAHIWSIVWFIFVECARFLLHFLRNEWII